MTPLQKQLYKSLLTSNLAALQNLGSAKKAAFLYTVLELGHLHVSSCNSNGGSDLHVILVHDIFVQPRCEMAVGIHSHNLLLVAPLRERTNFSGRLSVCKVWLVRDVEVLAGYSKGIVDGV